MLYLGNGARQITVGENQTLYVFPDFSDPTHYHYLPNNPHIAKMEDGTPAIRLLVYREDLDSVEADDEEAIAFLSLDVDLSWDPALIEEAASQLRVEGNLLQKPRLTPIFFRQGTVKLMLLDAVTPDGDDGSEEDIQPTDFVTQIMGSGSPSLYGDNRAIFQASLTKKGAAALSGALEGVTPIGVVYSLTFAGLQPAFNVRANVDWQRVYDHFSEQEKTDLLFYEKEIQKSIDKLKDERAIAFEVTIEGIGAEAMDSAREEVEKSVRQLIFDQFFEATFKRETAAGQETSEEIVDTLTHIARNGLTLGVGYTYRRKEITVEELRTLNLDWTARRAAERTIYPQAHMYNLLSRGGVTREQLITVVNGADDLWQVQPFEVNTTAAWEADGIAGITVDIEYDDADEGTTRSWSTFLSKAKPSDTHRDWMDRTSGNSCRYKYEVVFQDEGVPGPRPKVNSGPEWLTHAGTTLAITPRQLYDSVELEVGAVPNFSFTRWPAVQAILRYRTLDGTFVHYHDAVLKDNARTMSTRFRIDKGVPGIREVRFVYIGATGERVTTDWMPMPQNQWVVEDPHAEDLTVRAIVAGDRKQISNLLVDLEYVDPVAGIHETGFLSFSTDNINQPQSWTVHLADPTRRRYRYRMTLVKTDGDFMQTGWLGTDAPTLPVGEVYVRRLTVELVTGELDRTVEAVEVQLVYTDADHNLRKADTFTLGANSRAEWQVQLQDASHRAYQFTTTWKRRTGFNTTIGPTTSSSSFLIIPGTPPET